VSINQFDGQYSGLGAFSGFVDSGAAVQSTTPATLTVTLPLDAGIQPTFIRGKLLLVLYSMNVAATVGQVDFFVGDAGAPVNEYVMSIPAPVSATAGRGASYVVEFFISGNNAALIKTVNAVIATGTNNNYTADLRVLVGF
jgi:hypothetical protein